MFGGMIKLNPRGLLLVCGTVGVVWYFYFGGASPWKSKRTVNLKTLLLESIAAAEKGGVQVREALDALALNIESKGKTKEGANDPVTDADFKSHAAITSSLQKALGKDFIKMISEEHNSVNIDLIENDGHVISSASNGILTQLPDTETVNVDDVVIWIDPLDATQEFTENLLQYVTVMVCVTVKGEPVIGVVHKPFQHQTVWAWVAYGTSESLQTLAMNSSGPNQVADVIVSRSHAGKVEQMARAAFGSSISITPAGGAGYKVLQVICGKADAYVHVTLIKKWDVCAGNALLKAVGGKMTTLNGDSIQYDSQKGVAIDDGLLATMHDHGTYLKALRKLRTGA